METPVVNFEKEAGRIKNERAMAILKGLLPDVGSHEDLELQEQVLQEENSSPDKTSIELPTQEP